MVSAQVIVWTHSTLDPSMELVARKLKTGRNMSNSRLVVDSRCLGHVSSCEHFPWQRVLKSQSTSSDKNWSLVYNRAVPPSSYRPRGYFTDSNWKEKLDRNANKRGDLSKIRQSVWVVGTDPQQSKWGKFSWIIYTVSKQPYPWAVEPEYGGKSGIVDSKQISKIAQEYSNFLQLGTRRSQKVSRKSFLSHHANSLCRNESSNVESVKEKSENSVALRITAQQILEHDRMVNYWADLSKRKIVISKYQKDRAKVHEKNSKGGRETSRFLRLCKIKSSTTSEHSYELQCVIDKGAYCGADPTYRIFTEHSVKGVRSQA